MLSVLSYEIDINGILQTFGLHVQVDSFCTVALVALFLTLIIGFLISRHYASGIKGEKLVAKVLASLPADSYSVINDIMLPTKDGTTTQIDHIVVCRFGIFVIETKDYSGWIFGSERQRQWTQSLHFGWGDSEKFHFQNPIRQNWRHIYVLAELLKAPKRFFHNVVVFTDSSTFMTQMPNNVMRPADLSDYITSFRMPVLGGEYCQDIILSVQRSASSLGEDQRNAHIYNLKKRHDAALLYASVSNGTMRCQRCGGTIVLRHRKSDGHAFYGCSNYPDCRFTMSTEQKTT